MGGVKPGSVNGPASPIQSSEAPERGDMPTNRNVKVWSGYYDLTIGDDGLGVIDYNATKVFTNGHCHSLALAIHKLTRWPIKGIGLEEEDDYPDSPGHCINYIPEQRKYIDIKGIRKTPHDRYKVLNSRVTVSAVANFRNYLESDIELAMPFAKALLKRNSIKWTEVA